jgi:outer membrane protein assembly factor BamE (lipoprotein component of BamABCDE complex)
MPKAKKLRKLAADCKVDRFFFCHHDNLFSKKDTNQMNSKIFYSAIWTRPIRTSILTAIFALCPAFSGCVSVGHTFPAGQVSAIHIGETTQNDVANIFGKPIKTGFLDNGMKTWTYSHYQYNLFENNDAEDLIIKFDKRGIVSSFNYNTSKRSK